MVEHELLKLGAESDTPRDSLRQARRRLPAPAFRRGGTLCVRLQKDAGKGREFSVGIRCRSGWYPRSRRPSRSLYESLMAS
jgi:hypothetical protein